MLADAESASREVARFDAELGSDIAPFASVLLRSESAAGSQIENLTASARAIATVTPRRLSRTSRKQPFWRSPTGDNWSLNFATSGKAGTV
ncbi:hypothetical protein BST42_15550 [Mycolicibacterium rhodesiae]|uniref:Uncharacterized protein n=1 Tax=Mycolicibacterium rhodesiae TaxID=36814 RepID=A0A1X0IV83_MYCRH|nr:hypothetical protein BST42_15550 [Mycolicibacterium rhodesiae]